MTFLETLEPLVHAAERYAQLTEIREQRGAGDFVEKDSGKRITLWTAQKEAADALCAAAIEFSKWGRQ